MERVVRFVSAGHTIEGTLSVPDRERKYPAIVLIPGSGQIDRNENHKKAKLNLFFELSHYLTKEGFVVLRYDKRGVGASEGDYWATGFHDNVADAARAVAFLKEQEEVDPERVFLIGHSEGAFISTRLAGTGTDIAGIVLLAGAAQSGEATLHWQALKIVEGMKGFNKWIIDTFHIDVAKSQRKQLDKIKQTTKDSMRVQLLTKLNAKWMREFLAYDPSKDMPGISVPVLAITGSKDIQVNPQDLLIMKEMIRSPYEYHIVPDLTHLFRLESGTASISNYAQSLKQPVGSRIPEIIGRWLKGQTA